MYPPLLQLGDKIGIVAFAKKIKLKEIQTAIQTFEDWGLEVVIGDTVGSEWNQFSGDDEHRRTDIQKMLDNPEIKAIISARGGYGCVRIIDKIDFSFFIENPKWLIGFSDITVFHTHINSNFNIPTIHGTMPVFFKENTLESINSLKDIILKGSMKYQIKSTKNKLCQDGKANGQLVGGNLSILYSLCGTDSLGETENKIVFLEDLSEYTYHIDRMLQNLKRNFFFKNIAGLIIGGFTKIKEGEIPFGKTPEEIIFEFCKELDIPIFASFPAGHINDNRALVFGDYIEMRVQKNELFLNWDALIQ